jgi:hypothetical protein
MLMLMLNPNALRVAGIALLHLVASTEKLSYRDRGDAHACLDQTIVAYCLGQNWLSQHRFAHSFMLTPLGRIVMEDNPRRAADPSGELDRIG